MNTPERRGIIEDRAAGVLQAIVIPAGMRAADTFTSILPTSINGGSVMFSQHVHPILKAET